MKFVCTKCGRTEPVTTRNAHCSCGGLWKLDFTPEKFELSGIDTHEWSQFRYRRYMALDGESWRGVTLGEGMTPVVTFDEDVSFKMDYFMPTLSFKDRGAAVLIAHCKAIGVDRVVQDSSGNAGNAVAAYCAKAGIGCEIFVPEGTSPKKIDMIRALSAPSFPARATTARMCAAKRSKKRACITRTTSITRFSMRAQKHISMRSSSSSEESRRTLSSPSETARCFSARSSRWSICKKAA